ncbi:MAG: metallophosphoesterase [Ignavibacteria bacterium]|nr:metallophosphoesterase [Ignavibacteria bacterium]
MLKCIFSTDIHGNKTKFDKFFKYIMEEKPDIIFLGGDILPSGIYAFAGKDVCSDFIFGYFRDNLLKIRDILKKDSPEIFLIMGNDDPKIYEENLLELEKENLFKYANQKVFTYKNYFIAGYSYVPPTPFMLKDWEKYDVSRFVDHGSISPEEGYRTVEVANNIIKYSTIENDLNALTSEITTENLIFLFHSPPYKTNLDRINTHGKMIDYVKIDENVGSVAIKKFIELKKPLITLHGHIHESSQLTGKWFEYIGRTLCINGAYQGEKLSIIKINLAEEINFERILL